ncbi:MAG: hypothetical protein Q9226_002859 [Calogaya cf. arnoldii]
MKICNGPIVQYLILTFSCFIHLTKSRTLQLPSDTPNTPILNQTTAAPQSNELPTDQNIANYLQYLASAPTTHFNRAKLILVLYGAGGIAPHRVRSTDINAHRSLRLIFRSGDFSPTLPPRLTYFRSRNDFPDHPDSWCASDFDQHPPLIWLEDKHEINFAEVQDLLPVERADALLKEAGYDGAYTLVHLYDTDTRPLQYCFEGILPWPRGNVVVEVRTGVVKEVNYPCLLDVNSGRLGAPYGERLTEEFLSDSGVAR